MSPSNWSSSSELFGSPLEDILEEVAMDVGGPSTSFEDRLLRDSEPFSQYRTSPSAPSSPSLASVSSLSTLSVHGSLFDAAGSSPSILELCELLGESQNVRHNDFSHLTLSGRYYAHSGVYYSLLKTQFHRIRTEGSIQCSNNNPECFQEAQSEFAVKLAGLSSK